MPAYSYKAFDIEGKKLSGHISALSERDARKLIKDLNLIPSEVIESMSTRRNSLKIKKKSNRVFALLGDGECHEGTIWESANIGSNQKLGNLCAIVDWNQSAAQLMPIDDLPAKWESFGWDVTVIDGHSESEIKNFFSNLSLDLHLKPKVLIAKTIKGKGVSITEGHGAWHHKVPNDEEFEIIKKELSL